MGTREARPARAAAYAMLAIALGVVGGCGDDAGGDSDGGDGGDSSDDGDGGDGQARYSQLVRGDRFSRLVIEMDIVPGFEPYEAHPARLAELIDDVVDKPDGVEAAMDGALEPAGAEHAWTFDELQDLADRTFDRELPGDAIGIHILFVDGHSSSDTSSGVVLGLAWASTHIAMFAQTIQDVCAASVLPAALREEQCRQAELSILLHEAGHLLGLVDNGLPMVQPHRDPDPEHGAHDADDGCVMYWAYEGGALFDAIGDRLLGGGDSSIGFDQECLADLAAERAR